MSTLTSPLPHPLNAAQKSAQKRLTRLTEQADIVRGLASILKIADYSGAEDLFELALDEFQSLYLPLLTTDPEEADPVEEIFTTTLAAIAASPRDKQRRAVEKLLDLKFLAQPCAAKEFFPNREIYLDLLVHLSEGAFNNVTRNGKTQDIPYLTPKTQHLISAYIKQQTSQECRVNLSEDFAISMHGAEHHFSICVSPGINGPQILFVDKQDPKHPISLPQMLGDFRQTLSSPTRGKHKVSAAEKGHTREVAAHLSEFFTTCAEDTACQSPILHILIENAGAEFGKLKEGPK